MAQRRDTIPITGRLTGQAHDRSGENVVTRQGTGRGHEGGGGPLRWAHCPHDGRLHLLAPTEVTAAATGGHAQALCGRLLPAEGLTLAHGWAGALCIACLAGITAHQQRSHPVARVLTTPDGH